MTRFEKSVLVLTLAVTLAIPYLLESYALRVAASVLYFIILASSWNLLLGYAGVLSFAHAAFAGIGAYTTGLLSAGFLGDHVCASLVKLDLLFNAGGRASGQSALRVTHATLVQAYNPLSVFLPAVASRLPLAVALVVCVLKREAHT